MSFVFFAIGIPDLYTTAGPWIPFQGNPWIAFQGNPWIGIPALPFKGIKALDSFKGLVWVYRSGLSSRFVQ